MSENWLILVPQDPQLVPQADRQAMARDRFAAMVPGADAIEVVVNHAIEFFDCGGNFERTLCPRCQSEIPDDWWQDRMEEDYEDGFKLASYILPCCSAKTSLHALVYESSQTFGRFALEAQNPNIEILEEAQKRELEEILGARLMVIYKRL